MVHTLAAAATLDTVMHSSGMEHLAHHRPSLHATAVDEARLLEKLKAIEALHAGATTKGERVAAAEAHGRIIARLKAEQAKDNEVELTFTLQNPWACSLFIALCRRYGLKPFRYRRQRRTMVNMRGPGTFLNNTLRPEFCAMDRGLMTHLHEATDFIIHRGEDRCQR